ncbi:MogA/MoaB family molybdenum cofactor biosynthesis protein (plasmid) [Clostridium botulinum]|uniref:Cytoplasmic protein n=1 Tax=Clostridium botulinum C/D str. DC5 TaxID=1443128 RepID=A0A0A0IH72_CLOBO|nr:MogA/MoaB family molybdenum cofactor biosynthesis protein [Clostridium botulinum]KGM98915.1 cytoplasmic protein [Clostridium botulinum C/D str. DC5]KOC50934.1 cytoplasmic protein [Clostridium botulinum]KOC57237.1 cytoplasmic protein [Clostridium botulinum]MCD3235174.1 MogA/MoaB family molybdenum cofactor biosynthesis protein [Clostridium botulinum D/C]MCD3241098.1 MogA/MoaB family molybdenum cofactor biosynthesis protein [Clostridium botulinum D/C]
MIKVATLTISDKGSKGERVDTTGAALKELLEKEEYKIEYYKVIPDEMDEIIEELIKASDNLKVDLILTNGGTGFSKRDITPEATLKVIKKEVPGIPEAMRLNSLKITPKAMLSRGVSGIRNSTLIINLPGSPKGAVENIQVVLPALKHGIEILKGEVSECAR